MPRPESEPITRLARVRQAKGRTRSDVCRALVRRTGEHYRTWEARLRRYELGLSAPKYMELRFIAEELGVGLADIEPLADEIEATKEPA